MQATQYAKLTPKLAWLLAAPHTWPASIMSVLVACAAASALTGELSVTLSLTLLVICILMQSAVNTFNDYFDYVKGVDSTEDNVDPSDAILVYNNINPRSALVLAIGFVVVAFILGIYAIVVAGWVPLVIALIGAVFVVLYSGGKTPISYLPVGEIISGLVMGGLIFIACYFTLTRSFSWPVIVWAIPTVIGVALIMFTNNTCDIEKDIAASRKTLAVVLKRSGSCRLYRTLTIIWIVMIIVIVAIWFTGGLILVPFMLLAGYPFLNVLMKNPLEPKTRISAISQICTVNVVLGAFYAASIFISSTTTITI